MELLLSHNFCILGWSMWPGIGFFSEKRFNIHAFVVGGALFFRENKIMSLIRLTAYARRKAAYEQEVFAYRVWCDKHERKLRRLKAPELGWSMERKLNSATVFTHMIIARRKDIIHRRAVQATQIALILMKLGLPREIADYIYELQM